MIHRLTPGARSLLKAADQRSRQAGAPGIRPRDLLMPLFDRPDTPAGAALVALGLPERRRSLEQELAEADRRGGLSRTDAHALAGIGIDVDAVVQRAEHAHGEGALDPRRTAVAGGERRRPQYRALTAQARAVVERAVREAADSRARHIGDQHFLLALAAPPGLVADVLAEHRAGYADIRRALGRQPPTP